MKLKALLATGSGTAKRKGRPIKREVESSRQFQSKGHYSETPELDLSRREKFKIGASIRIPSKPLTQREVEEKAVVDGVAEHLAIDSYKTVKLIVPDSNDWTRTCDFADFMSDLDTNYYLDELTHDEIESELKNEHSRLYLWLYRLALREQENPTDQTVNLLSLWQDFSAVRYKEEPDVPLPDSYFHWRKLEHPEVVLLESDWKETKKVMLPDKSVRVRKKTSTVKKMKSNKTGESKVLDLTSRKRKNESPEEFTPPPKMTTSTLRYDSVRMVHLASRILDWTKDIDKKIDVAMEDVDTDKKTAFQQSYSDFREVLDETIKQYQLRHEQDQSKIDALSQQTRHLRKKLYGDEKGN